MSLTTYNDIKARIKDADLEIIPDNYPDGLHELADSETPIYYGDIIEEWREMPMEYSDKWRELGTGDYDSMTITRLMQLDLYLYYFDRFTEAYNELCTELEEQE